MANHFRLKCIEMTEAEVLAYFNYILQGKYEILTAQRISLKKGCCWQLTAKPEPEYEIDWGNKKSVSEIGDLLVGHKPPNCGLALVSECGSNRANHYITIVYRVRECKCANFQFGGLPIDRGDFAYCYQEDILNQVSEANIVTFIRKVGEDGDEDIIELKGSDSGSAESSRILSTSSGKSYHTICSEMKNLINYPVHCLLNYRRHLYHKSL